MSKVNKAVFNAAVLNGGGKLNTEQANAFIKMIIDEPTILKEARTVPMKGDSKKIESIGFGQRVLNPATEGTDPGQSKYSAPTTGTVTLQAKEFIAVVKLTDDTIETNIEGKSIEDTVMQLLAERVALDMEEIIVNGDTSGGSDDFLQQLDGVRKQLTAHVVDAQKGALSKDLLKQAKKAVPAKYLRNPSEWRFYCSNGLETDWVDLVGERLTANGDDSFINGSVKSAYGVPVKGIAMLQDYEDTSTQVSDIILTHPKNIVIGISRDIRIELERAPRERATYIVLTLKMDVKFEDPKAAAKIIKVKA